MSQGFTKGIPIDYDNTLSADSALLVSSQRAVKGYIDNGLATKQNTLVGTESVLLPTRLLFKQNTTIAHTGVTGETVIATYLVPANTIQANDIIKWLFYVTCTNNANAKTLRGYFNTTANLSGSPILVGTRTLTSLTGSPFGRELISNNSQTSQRIFSVSTSFTTTEGTTTGTFSSTAIDFTVNQYFVIAFDMATGTDTITLQQGWAQLMR